MVVCHLKIIIHLIIKLKYVCVCMVPIEFLFIFIQILPTYMCVYNRFTENVTNKTAIFFFFLQLNSVAQSCLTLGDPMDCRTTGLPVHHQLLEFIQTHVHSVDDAIKRSHSLLSPSPPAFNLSQNQGLFK